MNFKNKKEGLFILLLIFSCLPLVLPLLKPGFFPIHDDQHFVRLQQLDQALKDGHFPARWVKEMGFGYGYPLFNFYPPFLYYLAEAFHLLGFSFLVSIKLVFILSFPAAGLLMYLLARDFTKKSGAFLAGFLYLYLPYRAVDCYVRGALAELLALAWLPGLLWSGGRIFYEKGVKFRDLLFNSLFLFLLMMTHNLTMMLFLPFYLGWCLFFALQIERSQRLKRIALFSLSCFLGAGWSASFWLPALIEKKYTLVDKVLLNKLYHYGHHFVSFSQLFNSPFGYGGSLPGLIDGLSFQLGKIHLAALLIGLVLFSYLFWKKKTIDKPVFFIALILFLGAVFMTLTPSRFIWRRVKPFWYVQFPWRFLGVAGPFLCLAAGFSLRFKKKKINSLVAILLVLSALIINLKFFKPEKSQLFLKDADLLTEEEIKWEVSRSSFEYLPRGAVLKEVERGTKLAPAISQDELVEKRVEIIQGEGEIELEADKTHQLKFRTSAQEELELELNIFSFPGWQVLVDDQKINYQDNNDLRLMTFSLPPGEHQVEVEFQRTAVRQWADIISLFSLFLSFFSSFYIIERRSNDEVSSIYK